MRFFRDGGRWAREFVSGPYRGAPVDYVMALAMVLAAMAVVIAGGF